MGFFEVQYACSKCSWKAYLNSVHNGRRDISPSCRLQSFHGRKGHLGVWFWFSTRVITEMFSTELPQQKLQNYLRAFASWHGINTNDGNSHIHYNTRVESVQKSYARDGSRTGWTLTVKELVKTSSNKTRATWTTQVWVVVYFVGTCNWIIS